MKKKLIPIILLFLSACILSNCWLQFVLIQGSSMAPAYKPWQLVVMVKQPSNLKPGDVVVFRCPQLDTILIKRIAACPGDTVQIKDGSLYVNGLIAQDIPSYQSISFAGIAEMPVTLSADEFFVLGDNLEYSKDSRDINIGCIKREHILGTIFPHIPISE